MPRTANYLLPIVVCLMAATAHGQIEIIAPSEALKAGQHYLLEVRGLTADDLPRTLTIAEPKATTKAMGPVALAGKFYVCILAATQGQHFVAIAISTEAQPRVGSIMLDVGGTPPPPDDLSTQVAGWLLLVPTAAREAPVENPISGETMTRQQAVGATYLAVAEVAEKLGSTKAADVMLATGLKSSYGDQAVSWKPFATAADVALAELVKAGVSAAEYGEALETIGDALQ